MPINLAFKNYFHVYPLPKYYNTALNLVSKLYYSALKIIWAPVAAKRFLGKSRQFPFKIKIKCPAS